MTWIVFHFFGYSICTLTPQWINLPVEGLACLLSFLLELQTNCERWRIVEFILSSDDFRVKIVNLFVSVFFYLFVVVIFACFQLLSASATATNRNCCNQLKHWYWSKGNAFAQYITHSFRIHFTRQSNRWSWLHVNYSNFPTKYLHKNYAKAITQKGIAAWVSENI